MDTSKCNTQMGKMWQDVSISGRYENVPSKKQ
jgi:hypothetical protein